MSCCCCCFLASDKPLIISFEGASGDYPGCTDLAYEKAVSDGADIIDCPVQITQDGVPICLGSINLLDRTSVANTDFINLTTNIPALQANGIFTFSLTWADIHGLERKFSITYFYAVNNLRICGTPYDYSLIEPLRRKERFQHI